MDKRVEERIHQRLEPYLKRVSEQRDDEHDMLPALFGLLLEQQRNLDTRIQADGHNAEERAKAMAGLLKHEFDGVTKIQEAIFQELLKVKERQVHERAELEALRKSCRISNVVGVISMILVATLLILRFVK